jgi:predicted phosphodiesterase
MGMKIRIVSDLHLEVAPFTFKKGDEDIVVLAGDISTCDARHFGRFVRLIESIDKPIIYIKGNHESYMAIVQNVDKEIRSLEATYKHFHFLDDQVYDTGDYRFIGSTLWSNLDITPPKDELRIKSLVEWGINDFNLIMEKDDAGIIRHFSVDKMISLNIAARGFIKKSIVRDKKNIVVTHFCPSEKLIDERYKGSALNPYFTCNCENLMTEDVPLWIFGHTHSSCQSKIGNTRTICNPRGYRDENKEFKSTLTVEV